MHYRTLLKLTVGCVGIWMLTLFLQASYHLGLMFGDTLVEILDGHTLG